MNPTKKTIIAVLILFIVSILAIFLGSVMDSSVANYSAILKFRVSRSLTAIFCGAGISVAGLLMQTLFQNPLAGPSVLGITSGSTLGVALAIFSIQLFGFQSINTDITVSAMAIIGALSVTVLILFVSKFLKKSNTLLIVGLMIGYFISSIVNVFSYYGDKTSLQSFVYWTFGNFEKEIDLSVLQIYYGIISLLIVGVFMLQKPLNLLLMGEKYAVSMGLNLTRTRLLVIFIVGILVGVITALCGPIAFLGIAVPHLARNFIQKSDHKWVIPFTLIFGASLALVCDIISRLPGLPDSLPLNAVTSFVGAPIVIWIIFKNKMA